MFPRRDDGVGFGAAQDIGHPLSAAHTQEKEDKRQSAHQRDADGIAGRGAQRAGHVR